MFTFTIRQAKVIAQIMQDPWNQNVDEADIHRWLIESGADL